MIDLIDYNIFVQNIEVIIPLHQLAGVAGAHARTFRHTNFNDCAHKTYKGIFLIDSPRFKNKTKEA